MKLYSSVYKVDSMLHTKMIALPFLLSEKLLFDKFLFFLD